VHLACTDVLCPGSTRETMVAAAGPVYIDTHWISLDGIYLLAIIFLLGSVWFPNAVA
jgi:hypothetical protein